MIKESHFPTIWQMWECGAGDYTALLCHIAKGDYILENVESNNIKKRLVVS